MIRACPADSRTVPLSVRLTDLCTYLRQIVDDPTRPAQHLSAALLHANLTDDLARAHMLEADLAVARAAVEASDMLVLKMAQQIALLRGEMVKRNNTVAALTDELIEQRVVTQSDNVVPFMGRMS